MKDFKEDEIVYFIENGRTVRKAYVAEEGPFYSLRFQGHSGEMAGIRLRRNRVYKTKEEAETAIKKLYHRG